MEAAERFRQSLEELCLARWQRRAPGLGRMETLLGLLDDPQKALRFVHVAGTNGKGSTSAMLSSICSAAGYTVGLFTSPHLLRYNERIRVDGEEISDEDLLALLEEVRTAAAQLTEKPTEFEVLTALGFLYFFRRRCDIVVLEVGLGGRLDPTNVIPAPEVAVVTGIGLEHTEYLGDTVAKIAGEKAGIIKPGAWVVLYGQSWEAESVVRARCEACGCPLAVTDSEALHALSADLSGQSFSYRNHSDLSLRLIGTYQLRNAAVALDTVDALRARGWSIPEDAAARGLAAARWPGRFEVLRREPPVIVDGAHNPNGVEALAECLEQYLPGRKVTFVMGVMADKGFQQMLDLVAPLAKAFITVTPESTRALDSARLAEEVSLRLGLPVRDAGTVQEGVALALEDAGPSDAVCVFGSLYQAGEVRALFHGLDEKNR
jgi:dihydrofolate synthase/folylpolyglutamate synthase